MKNEKTAMELHEVREELDHLMFSLQTEEPDTVSDARILDLLFRLAAIVRKLT